MYFSFVSEVFLFRKKLKESQVVEKRFLIYTGAKTLKQKDLELRILRFNDIL